MTIHAQTTTGDPVSGQTLQDIYRQLVDMLNPNGPRMITALTTHGSIIHASLLTPDYIIDRSGQHINPNA